MEFTFAIVCGVVCGIVAATPLVLQLRRSGPDLGRGFGAVIVAFVVIQVCMLVLSVWQRDLVAPFCVPAVLTYLLVVVVAAVIRHQHSDN